MKITKRIIAFLMTIVILTGVIPVYVLADNKEKFVYKGDDYKIEYIITDRWNGGYNVNVNIENESDEAIHNWEMSIIINGEIDSIWNAKIDRQNDKSYTIIGNDYNQKIAAKQSVSFGMIVKADDIIQPDINLVISKKIAVDSDKCLINYSVSSDWSGGFIGEVSMENKSGERINSWCIEFDMDNNIDNIWNAEIIEHKENHYLIGCASYNQNIEADCSVQFGFICNNGNSCNKPENIVLSNYTSDKGDKIDETADKEEIDVSQITEYADIEYKAGNCAESVIDDLKFVNLAPNDLEIKWETSDESTVKNDGTITRGDEDKSVTITAKIEYKGEVYIKTCPVTIKRINSLDANSLEDFSLSQLEELNKGDEDYETEVNDFGYIESIYGNYSDVKVDSYETALMSLYNIKSAIGIDDPFSELQVRKVSYDETGYIFKFEQVYNGMRVFGNSLTISADENGKTDYFCSDYFPIDSEINTIPVYSREDAIAKIKKEGYQDIVSDCEDLMILNYFGKCAIVWEFMCQKSDAWEEYEILVDARTGEIDYLNKISDNLILDTKATGKDLLKETRSFTVKETSMNVGDCTLAGPFYYLEDRKRKIGVYDAEGTDEPKGKEIIWNTDNHWSQIEVSAMANMEEVYDFYKKKLKRISYNGAWTRMSGKKIKVYINTDIEDNAYWYPEKKVMLIGTGTGGTFKKVSLAIEKDTFAHEFTHAVEQDETSLTYVFYGTPAIIKEAYADIFACYFEGDWTIGEDATEKPCLRNIEDPNASNNPKRVGGAYFADYRDFRAKNDYGGVHKNSTVISHVAYAMEQKKLSKQTRDIWYKSLCLGYKKHSDLYDVRNTVIKAAKKLKCSSSDLKKIKKCFNKANIRKSNCDETYNGYFKLLDKQSYNDSLVENSVQIIGKIVEADRDFDYSNNKDIQNAVIKSMAHNVIGYTDKNGNYSISHGEDNPISLNISKDGYIGENMYVSRVNAAQQDKYYSDLVELIPSSERGLGQASGYIKDSVTGKGIEHLKIEIRRGINNIYTDVLYEIDSQENGYYITPQLEAGNYCMEIYDYENEYISTYFNIKIFGDEIYADQNMTVSNLLEKNQMRAVLTWGEKPEDLDAHISYSLSNGNNGHVYYGNKINSIDGICISKLDVDDRDGFGPETMTVYNDRTGEYTYYVQNYSEEIEMKEGGNIMVRVYFGNENVPAYTFSMPYSSGKIWTVFRYNSSTGRISVINEVGDKVK